MRARWLVFFSAFAFATGGCTAFIAAELSGTQGSSDSDSGPPVGDCFKLEANQCGQCIANACENPSGSPPVSLAKICSDDKYASIITDLASCVSDPRLANYYCENIMTDGGTYAASIDTPAAAENNLQKCVFDNCLTSCSACGIDVPTCGSDTITLAEAGACGTCLDNAMNPAGAPCQTYVLQHGCYESSSGAIAQCAIPSGQCSTSDCSGLSSPDTNLDDASAGLFTCLWQHCQSSCPNP